METRERVKIPIPSRTHFILHLNSQYFHMYPQLVRPMHSRAGARITVEFRENGNNLINHPGSRRQYLRRVNWFPLGCINFGIYRQAKKGPRRAVSVSGRERVRVREREREGRPTHRARNLSRSNVILARWAPRSGRKTIALRYPRPVNTSTHA